MDETEDEFETELKALLSKHSKQYNSDTADFILASYIKGCLEVFNYHVKYRDDVKNIHIL